MRRLIGFAFVWIAVGMALTFLIKIVWIELIIIALLVIIGYNLFNC